VQCADPAHHLVAAAKQADAPRLVYISIVGVDRVPFGYYRRKLADERLIAAAGLPWSVLRTISGIISRRASERQLRQALSQIHARS
jgi:uncharacterized protein YbjT (DUF2867 family)